MSVRFLTNCLSCLRTSCVSFDSTTVFTFELTYSDLIPTQSSTPSRPRAQLYRPTPLRPLLNVSCRGERRGPAPSPALSANSGAGAFSPIEPASGERDPYPQEDVTPSERQDPTDSTFVTPQRRSGRRRRRIREMSLPQCAAYGLEIHNRELVVRLHLSKYLVVEKRDVLMANARLDCLAVVFESLIPALPALVISFD